jgi:hypothetical protein
MRQSCGARAEARPSLRAGPPAAVDIDQLAGIAPVAPSTIAAITAAALRRLSNKGGEKSTGRSPLRPPGLCRYDESVQAAACA